MLTILTGILVGLALGLTGGGGSILALPLLVYVLGVPPVQAVTISLATVSLMAMTGAAEAVYTRLAEWRTAFILSVGGMIAAPFGSLFSATLSEAFILNGFAVLMILVAISMGIGAFKIPESMTVLRVNYRNLAKVEGPVCQYDDNANLRLAAPCSAVLFIAGILTGLLSSIFGVGGGFLIVPALLFVTRMDIQRAVATSLLIISLIGLTGVVSALLQGRIPDIQITSLFLVGGVTGMGVGRMMVKKIPTLALQKIFVIIVLLLAGFTFVANGFLNG